MPNYSVNFSENIRALRKEKRLTQKAFADLLGYSEKTVSKWECGASVPGIETLFDIAKVLQTSIESLFSGKEIYYLGIDGGGTKTALALADKDGNVIRTLKAAACNPMDIGIEAAKEILKEAVYEICREIPTSAVCAFAGIAGGTAADMQERLKDFFEKFNFLSFKNDSDNKNVIAAGLGKSDGMTVILGTGVCVYTQKNCKHERLSGWGYLIDDGGSGYNLGRDALSAYFSSIDGTGPRNVLTQEIEDIYPGGAAKVMEYIYSVGKRAVASFAPAVFAAIEKNDEAAKKILDRNMQVVAHLIETAAEGFSQEKIPVVLAGGLTCHPCVLKTLKKLIKNPERLDIKVLEKTPLDGALILAKQIMNEGEI